MSDPVSERVANYTLLLAQEMRNTSRLFERMAEALHSATEAMLATKREVHDAIGPGGVIDEVVRGVRHELGQVSRQLAVISKDVDDVERVTREVTGAHALAVEADSKVGLLRTFGDLPRFTQIAIVVAFVLAIAFGGLGHWFASWLSK